MQRLSQQRIPGLVLLGIIAFWAMQSHQAPRSEDTFSALVRGLRPSVALVTVQRTSPNSQQKAPTGEFYGTASVVKSNASATLLLTANHVINNAQQITVRLDDGRQYPARVVQTLPDQDAALLEIAQGWLPPIHRGHSKDLEAGDPIGVAGYPIPDAFEEQHLGTGLSVYAGRVASIRQSALELDLPIIPGESGGPVFDGRDGTIIGIASSRFEDERAIGFAVPIEQLSPMIEAAAL